jgi:hypothetical protein
VRNYGSRGCAASKTLLKVPPGIRQSRVVYVHATVNSTARNCGSMSQRSRSTGSANIGDSTGRMGGHATGDLPREGRAPSSVWYLA